jgi:hypothetical protein
MNKKVIWIGIASALLIGGGVFWWMRSKNQAAEEEAKKKAEEEAKQAEEDAKNKSEQDSKSDTKPKSETKPEPKSFDLKEELKKFAGKRFVANKPTAAYTSEYLTKPFIFGGTDGKGNIGKGIYAGVLRDLKKDPLSGKIVAQLENVSSYMKATDGTVVTKFWVDYKTIFPA